MSKKISFAENHYFTSKSSATDIYLRPGAGETLYVDGILLNNSTSLSTSRTIAQLNQRTLANSETLTVADTTIARNQGYSTDIGFSYSNNTAYLIASCPYSLSGAGAYQGGLGVWHKSTGESAYTFDYLLTSVQFTIDEDYNFNEVKPSFCAIDQSSAADVIVYGDMYGIGSTGLHTITTPGNLYFYRRTADTNTWTLEYSLAGVSGPGSAYHYGASAISAKVYGYYVIIGYSNNSVKINYFSGGSWNNTLVTLQTGKTGTTYVSLVDIGDDYCAFVDVQTQQVMLYKNNGSTYAYNKTLDILKTDTAILSLCIRRETVCYCTANNIYVYNANRVYTGITNSGPVSQVIPLANLKSICLNAEGTVIHALTTTTVKTYSCSSTLSYVASTTENTIFNLNSSSISIASTCSNICGCYFTTTTSQVAIGKPSLATYGGIQILTATKSTSTSSSVTAAISLTNKLSLSSTYPVEILSTAKGKDGALKICGDASLTTGCRMYGDTHVKLCNFIGNQAIYQTVTASTNTKITCLLSTSTVQSETYTLDYANASITVLETGLYSINSKLWIPTNSTTGIRNFEITKNGSTQVYFDDFSITKKWYRANCNAILTANDVLTFYFYHTDSSSTSIGDFGVMIFKIGAV